MRLHDMGNVASRAYARMHQSGGSIGANMSLHFRVPIVALLRLRHLRVAPFVLVLSRLWGGIKVPSTIVSSRIIGP